MKICGVIQGTYKMVTNITIFLIFVTLMSVTAQTFQYSRGWTNGKRDGRRSEDIRDEIDGLKMILSPCLVKKLKYVLDGKPINERLLSPCRDYPEEDAENQIKRFKSERTPEALFDVFQ